VKGCNAELPALLVDVGTVLDEEAHHVGQIVLGGEVKRVEAAAVLEVDVLGALLGKQGSGGLHAPPSQEGLERRREFVTLHLLVAAKEHELKVQLPAFLFALLALQREPSVHRHAIHDLFQIQGHAPNGGIHELLLCLECYHQGFVLLVHIAESSGQRGRIGESVSESQKALLASGIGGREGGRPYNSLLPSFHEGSESPLVVLDL